MIINTIKKEKQDPQKIKEIIDLVIQQGGIEYAENQMYNYQDKALALLEKVPDSPAKSSFELLIDTPLKELNSFYFSYIYFKIPFIEFYC